MRAVGLGQHSNAVPLFGTRIESGDELVEQRHEHLVESVLYRHRHRRVVDILRCEAEVYELLPLVKPQGVKPLLEEILHSLDIVVGDRLMLLDAHGISLGELFVYLAQDSVCAGRHIGQLRNAQTAERDEILHFHLHAVTNQGVLRKIPVETRGFAAIAAINRRNRRQCVQLHI